MKMCHYTENALIYILRRQEKRPTNGHLERFSCSQGSEREGKS